MLRGFESYSLRHNKMPVYLDRIFKCEMNLKGILRIIVRCPHCNHLEEFVWSPFKIEASSSCLHAYCRHGSYTKGKQYKLIGFPLNLINCLSCTTVPECKTVLLPSSFLHGKSSNDNTV